MKSTRATLPLVLLLAITLFVNANPRSGFFLPDSVSEMTLKFRRMNNLVILPVTINDSVQVNLVLDTGCRNLILFGKKFLPQFILNRQRPVNFSGLGNGDSVTGVLSIGNRVGIQEVLGEKIPVVIVPERNLFGRYRGVHGVIGYDIFLKFEIELDHRNQTITFRSAARAPELHGFSKVPLRIVDARPVMQSRVALNSMDDRAFDLMIDTGSEIGLLLKTSHMADYAHLSRKAVIGIGLNGPISGFQTQADKLVLDVLELKNVPTGIIGSEHYDYGTLGMEVLNEYIVVLNYCKGYVGFKSYPS